MDEKTWLIIYAVIGWLTAIIFELRRDHWKYKHDDAITAWTIESNNKDKQILKLQEETEWISVKDRLPEIGKDVLIYYPKWDGDEIQVAKLEDDGMMFDICGEFNIGTGAITHWMPLPEPPKDGDTE